MKTIALVVALAAAQGAATADRVALGDSRTVASLDLGKLKGDPLRLAWSPDRSELFLMVAERDSRGVIKSSKQFVVSVADGKMKSVDAEPAWASKYWSWKSGQASPASPAFKIAVETKQEAVRATALPTGGALARGATTDPTAGTTASDVNDAALQSQTQMIYTLKVGNESIGEWKNEPVLPGVNFTWAPAPQSLLAFAKREGGPITILDAEGRKSQLTGPKAAQLPAWSDDGTRLAWLERKDRKHADILIADVTMK